MSGDWNIKKFKEKDNECSGPLTPENGETYDYTKGEPKYHTSYKISYRHMETLRKKLIEYFKNKNDWLVVNDQLDLDTIVKKINKLFGMKKCSH